MWRKGRHQVSLPDTHTGWYAATWRKSVKQLLCCALLVLAAAGPVLADADLDAQMTEQFRRLCPTAAEMTANLLRCSTATTSVTPCELNAATLAGHYTLVRIHPSLRTRRVSLNKGLYLFPDGRYLYRYGTDVIRTGVTSKGNWRFENGLIVLQTDHTLRGAPLDNDYLPVSVTDASGVRIHLLSTAYDGRDIMATDTAHVLKRLAIAIQRVESITDDASDSLYNSKLWDTLRRHMNDTTPDVAFAELPPMTVARIVEDSAGYAVKLQVAMDSIPADRQVLITAQAFGTIVYLAGYRGREQAAELAVPVATAAPHLIRVIWREPDGTITVVPIVRQ